MSGEIDFIREVLDDAAIYVRQRYAARQDISVSDKGRANDLLTEVDVAVQAKLVKALRSRYPDDSIAAEEEGMGEIPADPDARCWLIDPIDGTQNFIRGLFPSFGISLGLAIKGTPVAGGVAVPGTGDLFLAERGSGAMRNGEKLRVSTVDDVSVARADVDFGGPWDRAGTLASFDTVLREIGQMRCHCAAVIGLCSVATADVDAYLHVGLHPWDFAASKIIVEEAGGRVTRLDGTAVHVFDGGHGILASNGLVHDGIMKLIRRS